MSKEIYIRQMQNMRKLSGVAPLTEREVQQYLQESKRIFKEAKGKDHDKDGDIDSDDYLKAKDKAIKKAMAKDKDSKSILKDEKNRSGDKDTKLEAESARKSSKGFFSGQYMESVLRELAEDSLNLKEAAEIIEEMVYEAAKEVYEGKYSKLREKCNHGVITKEMMVHEVKGEPRFGEGLDDETVNEMYKKDMQECMESTGKRIMEKYKTKTESIESGDLDFISERLMNYRLLGLTEG